MMLTIAKSERELNERYAWLKIGGVMDSFTSRRNLVVLIRYYLHSLWLSDVEVSINALTHNFSTRSKIIGKDSTSVLLGKIVLQSATLVALISGVAFNFRVLTPRYSCQNLSCHQLIKGEKQVTDVLIKDFTAKVDNQLLRRDILGELGHHDEVSDNEEKLIDFTSYILCCKFHIHNITCSNWPYSHRKKALCVECQNSDYLNIDNA